MNPMVLFCRRWRFRTHTSHPRQPSRIRKIVNQVGQGFRVHQPVFERHSQQRLRSLAGIAVHPGSNIRNIPAYDKGIGPLRCSFAGQLALRRVNSECKQVVQLRGDGVLPQMAFSHKIPVKCFEMTEIENQPMTVGNGPVIQGLRKYLGKQAVRNPASAKNLLMNRGTQDQRHGRSIDSLR